MVFTRLGDPVFCVPSTDSSLKFNASSAIHLMRNTPIEHETPCAIFCAPETSMVTISSLKELVCINIPLLSLPMLARGYLSASPSIPGIDFRALYSGSILARIGIAYSLALTMPAQPSPVGRLLLVYISKFITAYLYGDLDQFIDPKYFQCFNLFELGDEKSSSFVRDSAALSFLIDHKVRVPLPMASEVERLLASGGVRFVVSSGRPPKRGYSLDADKAIALCLSVATLLDWDSELMISKTPVLEAAASTTSILLSKGSYFSFLKLVFFLSLNSFRLAFVCISYIVASRQVNRGS